MLEDTRLAGIRAKPVLCGSFVWNRGRIVRGNWLDGLRVSKNGTNGQRAGRGHRACYVVGHLAHSGDRLFGNGDAAWRALARVFPGVYGGDDRDARADCLDLRENEKRSLCSVHARQLDGFARGGQSWRRKREGGKRGGSRGGWERGAGGE